MCVLMPWQVQCTLDAIFSCLYVLIEVIVFHNIIGIFVSKIKIFFLFLCMLHSDTHERGRNPIFECLKKVLLLFLGVWV